MNKDLFNIELNLTFPSKNYKSLLSKLRTFVSYCATVGIHQADGKKKVIRRYSTTNKKGKESNHVAGKSHRMNVVKLAYQNEFGATIPLRTKYKIVETPAEKGIVHVPKLKITRTKVVRESVMSKKQGYLLLDKQGNFVAYFKRQIVIPPRPFLTKLLKEKDMKFSALVSQILLDTFVTRKYTSSKAIHKIAQLTQLKVKQNIRLATPKASELTKKAKGFNQPLVDEKDRILKAIKYKIYKDYNVIGEPGYKMLQKQMKHRFDKLLDSAKQFDKIVSEEINKTKIFKYKKINPNAPLYEMPQSIFDGLYDEY